MKITKRQLRRIIKEEKAKLIREQPQPSANSGALGGSSSHESSSTTLSIKDDIKDAIQMLESEEDATGSLFYVINRLYTALEKL